ncbi:hypothetical protein INS49_014572 [Diaporthe citri]|uniref:uncharacterized protein n=1 Tax=Diaporthe citri TaxID=83186 RepID=UPI001C7F9DEB|nr:uncharacterized protein INS49_014572 [Diaporthe citri]KAG6356698.1 hypothetical protein INS49_014572 [Diaporthe citri]
MDNLVPELPPAQEEAIKGFRTSSGHERSNSSPTLYERSASTPPAGLCKEDTIVVEGESSFRHQTLLASQITELNTNPGPQPSPVPSELANLRTIIKEHASPDESERNRNDRPNAGTTVSGNELPPSHVILGLLSLVRGEESGVSSFYGLYAWKVFEDLCRRIYFPIEPIPKDQLVLFYGAVSAIARSIDVPPEHQLNKQELDLTRRFCEEKFFQGVHTYEVMALPSRERVFAIYLAMIHAQNEAELTLQWTLTSAAARHCIALGYHREEGLAQFPAQEAETVRRIFWQIYISDKNLSLRLGKASTIQDFDTDIQQVPISEDPKRAPWDIAFVACTNLAHLQGCLYEGLYSSAARKHTKEVRSEVVSSLAAKLAQWYDDWLHINSSAAFDRTLLGRTFEPMHIVYYSVLTLLYRGETMSNSASEISPRCFEAARQGLQAHLAYYPKIVSSGSQVSSYLLW